MAAESMNNVAQVADIAREKAKRLVGFKSGVDMTVISVGISIRWSGWAGWD